MKDNNYMMYAEDISKELGISKGYAYKIIKELNQELKEAGFIVISAEFQELFGKRSFIATGHKLKQYSEGRKCEKYIFHTRDLCLRPNSQVE